VNANEVASEITSRAVAPRAAAGCAAATPRGWAIETGGDAAAIFDLASVTKPMAAMAIARAERLGLLSRSAALGDLVTEARGTASERMPLELLLAHRAGLDAHRPLYAPLVRGEAVDVAQALRIAAAARRPDCPGEPPDEGFPPLYSDLGYLLAGEALARAAGARDAGEAIARLVLEPLGIADQAGTVRELEARGVCGPFVPTETVSWRGGAIVGAVHDENAWALSGRGGSGHAGIFATVQAVLAFGTAVLDELGSGGIDWIVRERPGSTLRAGFDGKSAEGSSAGARLGPRSVGHLGFTGTSLWLDPDARVAVALLTNRVCPTRDHLAIRPARPWAHDALFERALELAAI
jgi:CubicO group peptidase (beta-lactamase class C family)